MCSPPAGGQFKRQQSSFRDSISSNGKFPPEAGRYHLVVSLACPWAHRALIVRKLKGLDKVIDVSYVHPHMGSKGWTFSGESGTKPRPERVSRSGILPGSEVT